MSERRIRERWTTVLPSSPWTYESIFFGQPTRHNGVSSPRAVRQWTSSNGNPSHRKELRGKVDVGSTFETIRQWYDPGAGGPQMLANKPNNYQSVNCTGGFWSPASPPTFEQFEKLEGSLRLQSFLTLHGMGATAIARTTPTNPSVDMMTFAGEALKEGLPKVLSSQTWADKRKPSGSKAGSEYLAWQFGALPFISDLKDLGETVVNQEKILAQYERDSGKNVRRKYRFDPIKTTTIETLKGVHPSWPGTLNSSLVSTGRLETETVRNREVWFSGCYTYYLNLDRDTRSRLEYSAQAAKRLYGIRVSPDVLYNLMPWSWAIDWVTNTGDVIQNLSAFAQDGLVLRYGYVMETSTVEVTRRFQGERNSTYPAAHLLKLSDSYGVTRKARERATPYGFGLDPDGFTAKQVSILAALGLSRQGRI